MRYNVDYCLFGFPNATGVGTSPCTTSMACGPLEGALEDGNLDAHDLVEYSYCSANGSAMTGDFYDRCLGCVSAGGDTNYLANCKLSSLAVRVLYSLHTGHPSSQA